MQVPGPVLGPLRGWIVVATVLASVLVAALLSSGDGALRRRLRERFVFGVPWGTALTVALVVSVYLSVQGGLEHRFRPLVVPFRSWSYFYPLGMVTAAFSHSSYSHLTGNMVSTVAFAPVAEYAWSHYPRRRGASTFTSLRTNPYARILAVPLAAILVGLFTALFAVGPVVGFSGVVFAFAGFALVTRPLLAVVALVAVRVLNLVLSAVQFPRFTTVAEPRVITPWWSNVAIQIHAIGLLAGVLLGAAVLSRSKADEWPSAGRVWGAAVVFAATEGLWAVYAPLGNGRFVLFRWVGVGLVFVLAALIVGLAARPDRSAVPVPGVDVAPRRVASVALVVALVGLSIPGVAYNVAPIGEQPTPEPSVEVRDYRVAYAEDVPNGYAAAIGDTVPIDAVQRATTFNASGVVVTSEQRETWILLVRTATLKNAGRGSVLVGGLGWRHRVYANLTGWSVAGNESVYRVALRPGGRNRTLAYTAPPSTADPVVAGRNVTLRATERDFAFVVRQRNRTLGTAPLPANMSATRAGGLRFVRNRSRVFVVRNGTRVQVASRMGQRR